MPKRNGWHAVGMRAPGPVFFAFVAVAGIVIGGLAISEFTAEDELRSVLHARGQRATGVVVEVLERSRIDEPLYVEVALPDGRRAEVSFVSSNDDLDLNPAEVGEKVELVIDPRDPQQNMVSEDFDAEWDGGAVGLASHLYFPAALVIVGGGLGIRAYRLGRPWGGVAGLRRRTRATFKELTEPWDKKDPSS